MVGNLLRKMTREFDKDRRLHKRVLFSSLVCISNKSKEEIKLTSDISYGGLFFFSGTKLMIGKKVQIDLCIPGAFPLKIEGEIRWEKCKGKEVVGYGIKFGNLTGEEIDIMSILLENYL